MKAIYRLFPLALVVIPGTGPAQALAVDPSKVSYAVGLCAHATSKQGVDDRILLEDGWSRLETVNGLLGDRFYSKGYLRASLSIRPNVGGSCIISFNIESSYDLAPLTRALERALHVKAVADNRTFALLPLPGKFIMARVEPIPVGSLVSVAVESR